MRTDLEVLRAFIDEEDLIAGTKAALLSSNPNSRSYGEQLRGQILGEPNLEKEKEL